MGQPKNQKSWNQEIEMSKNLEIEKLQHRNPENSKKRGNRKIEKSETFKNRKIEKLENRKI